MATDDDSNTTPADRAGSGPLEWWNQRSTLEKVLIRVVVVIAVGLGWYFFNHHSESNHEIDVSQTVKVGMQQKFDTDPNFKAYQLKVDRVDVMKQTGNLYRGMAKVRGPKGIPHDVPVSVTADDDRVMWEIEQGSLVWAAFEQDDSFEQDSPPAPTPDVPQLVP